MPGVAKGPMPENADVVVIGGGIIGVMTAWALAKKRQKVVLVEKGQVGAEQSTRNWGWIRAQGRDRAELPIMCEAAAMWRQLNREIGEDIGLRQTGVAYLARKPADIARYEKWLPHAKEAGIDTKLLSAAETQKLLPGAATHWQGALWTASDMRAEPALAVPALARAAVRDGVIICENCAARVLDIAAGRISGVITEAGPIKTTAVVVAGGAWSALFLRRHGVHIPQLSVRASVAATEPLPLVFEGAASDGKLAFRRRQDGGYTLAPPGFQELFIGPDAFRALGHFKDLIKADPLGTRLWPAAPRHYPDGWGTARRWSAEQISPFEKMRVLNPAPNRRKLRKLAKAFGDHFPALGGVTLRSTWAGMIDAMPDIVPVVDQAGDLPGLTIATGMSGHGFGIGPAFGQIAAQLVLGETVKHEIGRFRLSRFTEGTTLEKGPDV
ncbi:FAD-dependent oxidoreductase [Yoonia sp. BS5-3]|uniref:NAD(P)/FAD-dependent oxidoreductase n=1 Tax=Yoonia phaeophyticola TaxID=3137369 RepID=A0ABZ2V8U6_9RHOB